MATIGSQGVLRVLPNTRYDFSALTGATVEIPIAQHIDVLGYENAALQVRIPTGSFPKGSSMRIQLADDGFHPDDPTTQFFQTAVDGSDIGSLEVTDKTVFPFYQSISARIPGTFGRLMAITASFTGGADGGPTAVVSMDLVLTGGSVGTTIRQPSTYLGYAFEQLEADEPVERLSFEQPQVTGRLEPGIAGRLIGAVRGAIGTAKLPPGYPRFGNVNVAIQREPGELRTDVRPPGG
ncbi:MAG TPA: hypothetical protein VGW75_07265 [Solirubrobacteraceae bacterium]|jgi:hypothetical protein|nr:hypothetical protein [Solirubrobacteraceae bacterium]